LAAAAGLDGGSFTRPVALADLDADDSISPRRRTRHYAQAGHCPKAIYEGIDGSSIVTPEDPTPALAERIRAPFARAL